MSLFFYEKKIIKKAGKYLSVIKKVVPLHCKCGSSSVGRASAFQAECREFEPRLPLKSLTVVRLFLL